MCGCRVRVWAALLAGGFYAVRRNAQDDPLNKVHVTPPPTRLRRHGRTSGSRSTGADRSCRATGRVPVR